MTDLINAGAPVVSRKEIEIAAPPEVVGRAHCVRALAVLNPEIKSMSMKGPGAVGSTFRWKAGPGTITSAIQRLEPPRLVAWSGKTMGITAVDVFRLERRDGTTLVREEESWDGLVARVLRRSLQRTLDRSLESGLRHLKAESERRISEPA
jgi:hypothetical protein